MTTSAEAMRVNLNARVVNRNNAGLQDMSKIEAKRMQVRADKIAQGMGGEDGARALTVIAGQFNSGLSQSMMSIGIITGYNSRVLNVIRNAVVGMYGGLTLYKGYITIIKARQKRDLYEAGLRTSRLMAIPGYGWGIIALAAVTAGIVGAKLHSMTDTKRSTESSREVDINTPIGRRAANSEIRTQMGVLA